MRQHLDVVAHGFRFYGSLIAAVGLLVGIGILGAGVWAGEPVIALLGPMVAVGLGAIGTPWLWTGRALLRGEPWARPAGIALSVVMLGDVPVGASLGVLGLGVLLDRDVTADFQPSPAVPLLR